MKFWEITSVMWGERQVLEACLVKPEWDNYYDWYLDYDRLVSEQDRAKLDAIVPDKLVREILSKSKQFFFQGKGWLRSNRFAKEDEEVSALAAFEKFGGKALDEALEKGSFKVD
jgi:hypothetical protein